VSIEPEIKYEGFDVGPLVGGGLGGWRAIQTAVKNSSYLDGPFRYHMELQNSMHSVK